MYLHTTKNTKHYLENKVIYALHKINNLSLGTPHLIFIHSIMLKNSPCIFQKYGKIKEKEYNDWVCKTVEKVEEVKAIEKYKHLIVLQAPIPSISTHLLLYIKKQILGRCAVVILFNEHSFIEAVKLNPKSRSLTSKSGDFKTISLIEETRCSKTFLTLFGDRIYIDSEFKYQNRPIDLSKKLKPDGIIV